MQSPRVGLRGGKQGARWCSSRFIPSGCIFSCDHTGCSVRDGSLASHCIRIFLHSQLRLYMFVARAPARPCSLLSWACEEGNKVPDGVALDLSPLVAYFLATTQDARSETAVWRRTVSGFSCSLSLDCTCVLSQHPLDLAVSSRGPARREARCQMV